MALAGFWLAYAAWRNKTEWDQFHEVVLHCETPVFITTAIAATVAEVESGSTFRESCLATEVQKNVKSCYMVQCLQKLVSQRRCTQISAKSFNV